MGLADIDHIIVVVLENRSFDHMLGYLSLPGGPLNVEGLRADQGGDPKFNNAYNGTRYPILRLGPGDDTIPDPDHSRTAINTQITTPTAGGEPMGGFVTSYATQADPPDHPGLAMGHYDQASLPTYDFMARHFTVCDHWYSALPASTQINKLMLMSGHTDIADNVHGPLPMEWNVYDWLDLHQVDWCVYKKGAPFPFLALDPNRSGAILFSMAFHPADGKFRRYEHFAEMWASNTPAPKVMFIEPEYSEGPRSGPPCDDHSPSGVAGGQAFVADIYSTLLTNKAKWAKTLMIVTYDEHGGFFDHVPPLPNINEQAGNYLFTTSGVRVPAFLISPQVNPNYVFTGPLDHTSIIQLLVDKFTPNQGYSVGVNARQAHLNRILNALQQPFTADPPMPAIPQATMDQLNQAAAAAAAAAPPLTGASPGDPANAQAMHQAVVTAAQQHPELIDHPALADVKAYLDATT